MLYRKVEKYLLNWKENRNTALLIKGSRQIGKTYSIKKFISENFENSIIINFADNPDLIESFARIDNYKDLLLRLSLFNGRELIENKTIIFFDEIQLVYKKREELILNNKLISLSIDLLSCLKPLIIENKYRFILSGSLLGTELKNVILYPLGYLDEYQMYPLDFEEFLIAKGVGNIVIDHLKDCFYKRIPVEEDINNKIIKIFKEYMLVGGMPEAVDYYIKDNNMNNVLEIHKQISSRYIFDITQYINEDSKRLRVRDLYKAIPSELNKQNKRFFSSHVIERNYLKNNKLEDEFLWLTEAGIAIPVYNVTSPTFSLQLACERKLMKLFMNDIGLLNYSLFDTGVMTKILNDEIEINYGAPFENVVAEELYAHGFKDKLFYYNSKKHGEIDFIIEYENEILPIEIKSGKTNEMNIYDHTTLNNIMSNYSIKEAFVFGLCNVKKEKDKTYQFPIYMISFMNKN